MSSSLDIALGTTQAPKDKYTVSRNKYKPNKVNVLLIAESPPSSGGYFYSETTIGKDHLFRETMKVLGFWVATSNQCSAGSVQLASSS